MLVEYADKVDRHKLEELSNAFHKSKQIVPTRCVNVYEYLSCHLAHAIVCSNCCSVWQSEVACIAGAVLLSLRRQASYVAT